MLQDTHGYESETLSKEELQPMRLALYRFKAIKKAYLLRTTSKAEPHQILVISLVPAVLTWFFPEDFRDPSLLLEDRLSHSYKLKLVKWKKADRKLKDACKKISTSLIFDRDYIDWDDDCILTLEDDDYSFRKIIRPAAVGIAVCLLTSVLKANLDNNAHKYDDTTESTTDDTSTSQSDQTQPPVQPTVTDAEWAKFDKATEKRIMKNWHQPRNTKDLSASVSFDLETNGIFSNLKLSRSSGNKKFDNSCLEAMKKSQPLPHLPVGAESLEANNFDFFDDDK